MGCSPADELPDFCEAECPLLASLFSLLLPPYDIIPKTLSNFYFPLPLYDPARATAILSTRKHK